MAVIGSNWDSIEGWVRDASYSPTASEDISESDPSPIATENTEQQTTTTATTLDPDEGWDRGACVREVGAMVELVSCGLPDDGEVIGTASLEASCPVDTTHTVDLESGVACLRLDDYVVVDGFDADTCAFDGIPLYGDVYFTDSSFSADMVVAVEDSPVLADLTVVAVDSSFSADRCGLWHVVDSSFQADFAVAATESTFGADFTIAIGDNTFNAGT